MADLHTLSGLSRLTLFLKATVKKQVWIPAYTRHDGVVVGAHYAMVHVSDDHDEHKILAGQGSHSQKAAHAHLSQHDWFNTLPHDHKVAILQEHATGVQDKASSAAVLSTFKKKVLAGQAPTNAEWKAYDQADPDKKSALCQAADDASTLVSMVQGYAKWKGAQPGAGAVDKPNSVIDKPNSATEPAKDASAVAPPVPLETGAVLKFDSQYGKMNAGEWTVYNQSDDLLMLHKVGANVPGAANTVTIPKTTMDQAIAKGTAKLVSAAPAPLDHGVLNVPGKTNGINAELDKHKASEAAKKKAAAKEATAQNKADKATAKALFTEHGAAMIKKYGPKMGAHNVGAALDQMVKWEPNKFIKLAETFLKEQAAGPKEGDTKSENGQTYVLHNGKWHLQAFGASAWSYLKESSTPGAPSVKESAQAWLDHNPGKSDELSSSLVDAGHLDAAKEMGIYTPPGAKPDAGAALAAVASTNALLEKIQAAKLPESNSNHTAVNAKLFAIYHAVKTGDVKTLLMQGYGSNTYAVKAVKLANEALAVFGSDHKVAAGQKMGAHVGLSGAPASDVVPRKPSSKLVGASVIQAPSQLPHTGPSLSPAELPFVDKNSVSPGDKIALGKMDKAALVGDSVHIKYVLDSFGDKGAGHPVYEHAVELLYAIEKKKAPAVAASPAPSIPVAPHIVGSLKAKAAVQAISDALDISGSTHDLSVIMAGLPNSDAVKWQKVKKFGTEAMLYLQSQSGATPTAAVKTTPTAEEVAAIAFAEFPRQPAGLATYKFVDEANGLAHKGDVAGLAAYIDALPPHTAKSGAYAKELLALMKEKQTKTTFVMQMNPVEDASPNTALLEGWSDAIAHNQVPTKAQALAFEALDDDAKQDIMSGAQFDLHHFLGKSDEQDDINQSMNDAGVLHEKALAAPSPKVTAAKVNAAPPGLPMALVPLHGGTLHGVTAELIDAAMAGDLAKVKGLMAGVPLNSINTQAFGKKLIAALEKHQGIAPDAGPKDGDTKPGADGGTLVFKDGHWHKQGGDEVGVWGYNPNDMGMSGSETLTVDVGDGSSVVIAATDDGFQVMKLIDGVSDEGDYADFQSLADAAEQAEKYGAAPVPLESLQQLLPGYVAKPAAPAEMVLAHHFHNTTPGHSKFWSVSIHDNNMVTTYGKLGTAGTTTVKPFASSALATNAAAKLIKEKTANGYKGQGVSQISKIAGDAPAVTPVSFPPVPHKANQTNCKKMLAFAEAGDAAGILAIMAGLNTAAPKTKAYGNELLAAMGVQPSAKVVGATVTPAPAPTVTPTVLTGAEMMDGWVKTGGQKGYNEGGFYTDPNGGEWYCKFPAGGEKVAKNELLASKLYALAGVDNADVKLIMQGGKVGLASKIVKGAQEDKAALLAGKANGILSGFAVDAWLANWDAVGNNPSKGFDNILIKPDGAAVRIDAGGALAYGGAGGKKQTFGDKVIELKTMLDPAKNANTAAVFGKMSQGDIAASVAKVAAIPDGVIQDYCEKYGPGDASEKAALAAKLIARKADMVAQFPLAKKAKKAIKFDPSKLGTVPDFLNWKGPEQSGPASLHAKNLANQEGVNKLLEVAQAGSIEAIKALQLPFYGADGAVTHHVSVLDHPSQYVKGFAQQLINEIDAQLNPPVPFRWTGDSPLAALDKAYPKVVLKAGAAVAKLAKYIKLGTPGVLTSADAGLVEHKLSWDKGNLTRATFAKAAQAVTSKLPTQQKDAIQSYTGSGYHAINKSLWTGNPSGAAKSAGEALLTLGHEITPGTMLSRKISLDASDMADMHKAVGSVLQEPAVMSTSIRPTSWSGSVHFKMTVGPGVKGLYVGPGSMVGGGALSHHSGEDELVLPPNTRMLVQSIKSSGGQADADGFGGGSSWVIEVLILPTI